MQGITLSVVLPVYNEEANIERLYSELKQSVEALALTYELIFVDDGSSDLSFLRLRAIAEADSTVAVLQFRRNFGQTAALSAGIEWSHGDIIVLMDADMQNDPADIARLLAKIEEGYDVVSGWRKHRRDAFITRTLPSKMANGLISKVSGVPLHDYGCTLKAYRREVLETVHLYGEMHRFIPIYASWAGGRITEIPVNHRARKFGKSKYGLRRIMRVPLDLITVKFLGTYSTKPLYLFGIVGLLFFFAAILSEAWAIFQRFTPPYVHLNNNPLTTMGGLLAVLAVQIVLMGLLAELIMRTYYESQHKPTYLIRNIAADGACLPAAVSPHRMRARHFPLHAIDDGEVAVGMSEGMLRASSSGNYAPTVQDSQQVVANRVAKARLQARNGYPSS
ncbi:MAG TPA: glycosyltransferase family 2 protein [Ktedonobacterales bacterium]